ncbi:hypothetical protein M1843_08465 [Isoptericola sp. 4D.3]|uniref:Zinc-finger domain-containing protein n=1 Tax=Isoptericola peretonis TaxID=2918523 RepID=A0ABT0J2Q4_9MICO|nr:hypothetical protein [Isoptericola sp. 4D.3]
MTTDRPSAPDPCAALRDDLAAVATGTADGATRGTVMAHLAACDRCRAELSAASAAADELLLLAPEREPSAGFEGRVLARMTGPGPGSTGPAATASTDPAGPARATAVRRHRGRRTALLAVAGACLVAAGGAAVWTATAPDRELAASYQEALDVADGSYFAATDLTTVGPQVPAGDPVGTSVGTAFRYEGDPSWVFVVVRDAGDAPAYDVVVTLRDGAGTRDVALGRCEVRDDGCSVGVALDGAAHDVVAVRLTAPDGSTWAAAERDPEG